MGRGREERNRGGHGERPRGDTEAGQGRDQREGPKGPEEGQRGGSLRYQGGQSRAGRPAGRAGHSGVPQPEPAGYGLRRRPRPPHRAAEARQPVPGITTESKP